MPGEQRGPAVGNSSNKMGGKDEMIKASINLQDLRRRIYVKAKADSAGTDGVGSGCTKRWDCMETTRCGTTRSRKCCQRDRSHKP